MPSFSTGELSPPFTSTLTTKYSQTYVIFLRKDPSVRLQMGARQYSIVPFEHFQKDIQWAQARTHVHTHTRSLSEKALESLPLLFNLILAGSVLTFKTFC